LDGILSVTSNDEINLQVTDAIIREINELQDSVETNNKIVTNNDKIRYLRYIEEVVKDFRLGWLHKTLNPALAPMLINNFSDILQATIDSQSMAPLIEAMPYEIGRINAVIFTSNPGFEESKKILFLKYCRINPDDIITNIGPFSKEPFADSLLGVAALRNPVQLYSYAQATSSPEGILIRNSNNPVVKQIVQLSNTPNALLYFPFLDNILTGVQTIDSIKKLVGNGDAGYDSVGYYKLLVQTEIGYCRRLMAKDTPVAMFGTNGLRDMLQRKAIQHFITPMNDMHEEPVNVRMRPIDKFTPQDIYYMIVMGENDIYTSTYAHSFEKLLQRMAPKPRTDNLLMSVNMDYFKRFIKMAANYNQLDTFLSLMPADNSTILMKAFVSNLDKAGTLEDAVDVADSYSSIKNKKLLNNILQYVTENEQKSIEENNAKGKVIYGLLKTIFLSAGNPKVDLTKEIGIPSVYTVDHKFLADDSDRIIEQVFFYGDKDGKGIFGAFMNSFPSSDWKIKIDPEWVSIKSLRGSRVWIYANRPLDNDANLDDSAQIHLSSYLTDNHLYPTVVIHRGHSYWLPRTIDRMPANARIIVLGSCGGFQNLNKILNICPEAHIISTKEIGKGDINRPILNYLNQNFASGKTLVWQEMWSSLDKLFSKENSDVRESWEDYVPPYKNLGAIFIQAYDKKMNDE
jgi:hypothetical protein